MPLPKPKSGEKQKDFHSRCMGSSVMKSEYPDNKQRNAVCYSQWRGSKKKKSKSGIFREFIKRLIGGGEDNGE